MAAAPIFPGTIKTPALALTTANTTAAFADFWTPSTGGGKLESISIAQDGSSSVLLDWAVSTGGTSYPIGGTTLITSGAGTDGVTGALDALNTSAFPWARSDGVNRYFLLATGWKLQARLRGQLAAGKTVYITGQAGEF